MGKKQLVTALSTIAAATLLLGSLGASAADTHKCKSNEKWEAKAKPYVVAKK